MLGSFVFILLKQDIRTYTVKIHGIDTMCHPNAPSKSLLKEAISQTSNLLHNVIVGYGPTVPNLHFVVQRLKLRSGLPSRQRSCSLGIFSVTLYGVSTFITRSFHYRQVKSRAIVQCVSSVQLKHRF